MIRFERVVKRFGRHTAVDDVSIVVEAGETVALLGPNGSGKTTTLKLAAGLIKPDSGTITVADAAPWSANGRQHVSFLPQRVAFPESLTGREVVDFYSTLRRLAPERADAVLRFANLNGAGDRPVATYSGGMLQRLGLAVAVLPEASALLLDEPTAALDPDGLCAFYGLIDRYRAAGRTVLFTSHQVGDVERLADRFIVLASGRVVAELTQASLRERLGARGVIRVQLDACPTGLLEAVKRIAPRSIWSNGELIVPAPAAIRPEILDIVRTHDVRVLGLTAQDGSLESLYRELVAG